MQQEPPPGTVDPTGRCILYRLKRYSSLHAAQAEARAMQSNKRPGYHRRARKAGFLGYATARPCPFCKGAHVHGSPTPIKKPAPAAPPKWAQAEAHPDDHGNGLSHEYQHAQPARYNRRA